MARRRDRPRPLNAPRTRPPAVREFSAGGLVYRRRAGGWAVALGGRRSPRSDGFTWTIPKGHVEPGERAVEAAVREVREETGLVATVECALGDVSYRFTGKDRRGRSLRRHKRVRFFLMRYERGRFADRDAELDAVCWLALPEAEARVSFPNERVLIERARALLEGRGA